MSVKTYLADECCVLTIFFTGFSNSLKSRQIVSVKTYLADERCILTNFFFGDFKNDMNY